MINKVEVKNFGPLADVEWGQLGKINVIIGSNSSGKTFLLKALYSAVKSLEGFRRGNENKTLSELLADKLYWTYQVSKIGDLVSKGQSEALSFKIKIDNHYFSYTFGKDTTKKFASIENYIEPLKSDSVFFPAKEVLSIHQNILKSFEQDKSFGFDDTYVDLAKALSMPLLRGRNYEVSSKCRKKLEDITGGKIEYDEKSSLWQYKKGNNRYPIGVTAEGIKKIGVLDTLLGNRYITPNSIIFIDEPESALHPIAISKFLEIIADLSDMGMQFFMATHSYFVIKKLYLLAQTKNVSTPILSFDDGKWERYDLNRGMPKNLIIQESINLYKEEIGIIL